MMFGEFGLGLNGNFLYIYIFSRNYLSVCFFLSLLYESIFLSTIEICQKNRPIKSSVLGSKNDSVQKFVTKVGYAKNFHNCLLENCIY